MKRILVTGATGFIGSFIVAEGLRRAYEVVAGIRATSSLQNLPEGVTTAILSFNDKDRLKQELAALGRFEYIIHNAGVTKCREKTDFDRVNYGYTRTFIEALTESGTIPDKFLYVSSAAALGPGDPKTLEPVRLSDTPRPDTLYGKSKLKAEEWIRSQPEFPYLIMRPTGVYGPREKDYFVFLQTVNRHLEPAMGLKKQYITFIYVTDLVAAMYLALESAHLRKAWFVTDGKVYDNREYAAIVKKHLHRKALYLPVPLFLVKAVAYTLDAIGSRLGMTPTLNRDKYKILRAVNWICDAEPLQRELGFAARYDLDKGIEACVQWYKKEKWL
ncbi:MAG: NAD(P)-dependent oxidoreductase [Bacteroidales bacterium]|jgi:nucleoside-diphosphate-sugar epimerase|nr:NAD(P)-dependent oxidoreductase [Bacteroidales bacterium]